MSRDERFIRVFIPRGRAATGVSHGCDALLSLPPPEENNDDNRRRNGKFFALIIRRVFRRGALCDRSLYATRELFREDTIYSSEL